MTTYKSVKYNISGADLTGLTAGQIPNLDTAKITTGTMADARIAASNVTQHASSFDDNKIVNDISTLALRQASNENKGAYNSNSMSVDVFQDDTGIDAETNTDRNTNEYVSSAIAGTITSVITLNSSNYTDYIDITKVSNIKSTTGSPTRTGNNRLNPELDSNVNLASSSTYIGNTIPNAAQEEVLLGYYFGNSSDDDLFLWQNSDTSNSYRIIYHNMRFKENVTFSPTNGGDAIFTWRNGASGLHTAQGVQWNGTTQSGTGDDSYSSAGLTTNSGGLSAGVTYTHTISNSSSTFFDGLTFRVFHIDSANDYMFNNVSMEGTVSEPGFIYSATGNFTGTTITAPSSTSSMGAIITYQDQAGTNALNTDIILKLSADGGSNYTTATLTAMPDFSTGIKMAKVNDLTIGTAGTTLKYQILFANQSASKNARIRGVSLQY